MWLLIHFSLKVILNLYRVGWHDMWHESCQNNHSHSHGRYKCCFCCRRPLPVLRRWSCLHWRRYWCQETRWVAGTDKEAVNTLRPRQDGRHFPDDSFKWIFLNENVWISIEVSLKFVPKGSINNFPALVQIMAWRLSGDKPLSEPMMVSLLTHICVTRPHWVKETYRWFSARLQYLQCLSNEDTKPSIYGFFRGLAWNSRFTNSKCVYSTKQRYRLENMKNMIYLDEYVSGDNTASGDIWKKTVKP